LEPTWQIKNVNGNLVNWRKRDSQIVNVKLNPNLKSIDDIDPSLYDKTKEINPDTAKSYDSSQKFAKKRKNKRKSQTVDI
jgi:hypothetical protein